MMEIDDITGHIVDTAYRLHTGLGPGLLESVYEAILARDLERQGLKVERQRIVTFEYEGMRFEEGLRLDLLVEDRVIIEMKSVEKLAPVHPKQLLTYLRLMNLPVGLLINFGAATLKEGAIHGPVQTLCDAPLCSLCLCGSFAAPAPVDADLGTATDRLMNHAP